MGITFVISLIFFSIYFNQGVTDMTVEMSQPSIPVAYIDIDGHTVNEMHGYVTRMSPGTIRDSLTPIGEDRGVSFKLEKYDSTVSGLSVEVRSADGSRLIEDSRVTAYSDYNDYIEAKIYLKDLIEPETEYNLIIAADLSDGRTAYYYTRIIQKADVGVGEKLEFVEDFCLKTFSKDNIRELSTYMETGSEGDNSSFGKVDIHSSLSQLTWGELSPEMIGNPYLTIEEIGSSMASVRVLYQVGIKDAGKTHIYDITEYYRIRVTNQRTYLLSFDRTMDEVFVMDEDYFSEDKILLGIQNEAVHMVESEDGGIIAFVNGGRLYSYNATDNKIARLFAFYDRAEDDRRNRYRGSEIKILDVEENGNISFLVYGYMNRGTHEGEVGTKLYYYNSLSNTVEEHIFIPYYGSEKVLIHDVNKLGSINARGELYLYMDKTIYYINRDTFEYEIVAQNINEDTFFVSKSNKNLVWQEPGSDEAEEIRANLMLMNMGTGAIQASDKKASEYVRPIGFMNEDLIYGISDAGDLIYNKLGNITVLLNRIIIQSDGGTVLKEYDGENIYITGGTIENNQITLNRIYKDPESGSFTEIEDDHITNNTKTYEGKNKLSTTISEKYKRTVQIQLRGEVDTKTLKLLTPKEVIFEGGRTLNIAFEENVERFIVYSGGKVTGIYNNAAEAVKEAYTLRGTVIDTAGNELYKRGEIQARNQIMAIKEEKVTDTKDSLAVCLDTMLRHRGVSRNSERLLANGENVYNILNGNLNNAYILNLTDCTMDIMLYYVNKDIPVLAYLNDGTAVLIIGFNEQNIVLFEPVTGTIYKKGLKDSRQMFEENGNRFMTYVMKNVE